MALSTIVISLAIVVLIILVLSSAIRIVNEYERGVIFRLGRLLGSKGPGLFFIIPVLDRMVRVDLRVVTHDVPAQEVITRDNVPVSVNAVVFYKIVDPQASVVAVENNRIATSQVSQTTLRSTLGQATLDQLLAEREELNQQLQQIIDAQTDPWGIKVVAVEIKDVELPQDMRRAMARQAEAERDRRARITLAEGEQQAAAKLVEAATAMEMQPGALYLRTLQTISEASTEKASTIIVPLPMEFLRALGGRPG